MTNLPGLEGRKEAESRRTLSLHPPSSEVAVGTGSRPSPGAHNSSSAPGMRRPPARHPLAGGGWGRGCGSPPRPGAGRSPARAAAPHHEVAGEVVLPIVVRVLHGLDALNEFPQDLLLAHPAPPTALRSGSPGRPSALRPEPPPPHDPSPGCLPSPRCLASPAPGPARGLLAPLWLRSRPAHGRPAARSILPSLRPTLPGAATRTRHGPASSRPAHARLPPRPFPSAPPRPSSAPRPLALPTAASHYWWTGTPITGRLGFEGALAGLHASSSPPAPPRFPWMGSPEGRLMERWKGPLGARGGGRATRGFPWPEHNGRRWVPAAPRREAAACRDM